MKAKKYLHLDMDAYFAAIEQRDNPSYRNKPVIVCHTEDAQSVYGVVSSASYEARKFGIKSGLSVLEAKKLCPHGIYLKANFNKYLYTTKKLVEIAAFFTDLTELYSVDELFLDVTATYSFFGGWEKTAYLLQKMVKQKLGLTASIGGGSTRYIAKLASELHKPNGITIVPPEQTPFIWLNMPVKSLIGVGPRLEKKLSQIGVKTVRELIELPAELLSQKFGVVGFNLKQALLGASDSLLLVSQFKQPVKSVGHSLSLRNLSNLEALSSILLNLCDKVTHRLRQYGYYGRTVTFQLGLARLFKLTKAQTISEPSNLTERFYPLVKAMLLSQKELLTKYPATLIGVSVSNLTRRKQQLTVFDFLDERYFKLTLAVDKIKAKYGEEKVKRCSYHSFNFS